MTAFWIEAAVFVVGVTAWAWWRERKLRGWWRLRFGFCPLCDSSPPDPACPVCYGSRVYGHELSPERRREWKERFNDA